MDIKLHQTPDGLKWLSFGRLGLIPALKLRWHLRVREGFRREGRRIVGAGEWVSPDYVRGALRLKVGGDSWFGPHLIAVDEEGSKYLECLYRAIAHNHSLQARRP